MPIVVGIVAVLWVLLVLVVIGAVLVGALVLSVVRNIQVRFGYRRTNPAWGSALPAVSDQDRTVDDLGEVMDWQRMSGGGSYRSPSDATAWWWSTRGSDPDTMVIDGYRSGATAVAEKPATQHPAANQIWTIHPDHTAHWQDEAGDCPWCRNGGA